MEKERPLPNGRATTETSGRWIQRSTPVSGVEPPFYTLQLLPLKYTGIMGRDSKNHPFRMPRVKQSCPLQGMVMGSCLYIHISINILFCQYQKRKNVIMLKHKNIFWLSKRRKKPAEGRLPPAGLTSVFCLFWQLRHFSGTSLFLLTLGHAKSIGCLIWIKIGLPDIGSIDIHATIRYTKQFGNICLRHTGTPQLRDSLCKRSANYASTDKHFSHNALRTTGFSRSCFD